jgi:hypothetical protein
MLVRARTASFLFMVASCDWDPGSGIMLDPPGGQPVVERWWMCWRGAMSRAVLSHGWHVEPVFRFQFGEVLFDYRSAEAMGAGALADLRGAGEVMVCGVHLPERTG